MDARNLLHRLTYSWNVCSHFAKRGRVSAVFVSVVIASTVFVLAAVEVSGQQTPAAAAAKRPAATGPRNAAGAARKPASPQEKTVGPQTPPSRIALGPTSTGTTPGPAVQGPARQQSVQQTPADASPGRMGPAAIQQGPTARVQPNAVPRAPFQLSKEELQRLDQILTFWELTSGKVKTYSCRFKKWHYNAVWVKDQPQMISEGIIRYASPDKGELRVEKSQMLAPPKQPGGEPEINEVTPNDHWICDGVSVFQLDEENKKLIEIKLPPNMRGKQIADGPLPFMFGAEKEKLLHRYWIHEVQPPKDRKDEYWLEVFPRFAEDAANFRRVIIILDKGKFLPVAMNVYLPEDAAGNEQRDAYQFFDRTDNDLRHKTQQFFGSFIAPDLPRGWTKDVVDDNQPKALEAQPPAAPTANREVPKS